MERFSDFVRGFGLFCLLTLLVIMIGGIVAQMFGLAHLPGLALCS